MRVLSTALPTWLPHRGGHRPGRSLQGTESSLQRWDLLLGSESRGETAFVFIVPSLEGWGPLHSIILPNYLFLKFPTHNLSVDCTIKKISIRTVISSHISQRPPTSNFGSSYVPVECPPSPIPDVCLPQASHLFHISAQILSSPRSLSSELCLHGFPF